VRPSAQTGAADRLVAEGLTAFNQFGPAGGAAARSHFDAAKVYLTRALEIDPKNARALCALGNWYHVAASNGIAPEAEALARGRELIFSALASDDLCADVHCSLGKMALYHDDDVHAAERHIRRAVELDPSDPEALRLLSIVYKIRGRTEDAVEAARSAVRLSPAAAPLWNTLGDALLAAGRNAEAVDALKRAISLLSGYGPALERLERARARLGDFDLALELRDSRVRLGGQRERGDRLLQEAASHGAAEAIRRDAKRELDGLLHRADAVASSCGSNDKVLDRIVSLHAELGEWREAMDWVERAYEQRPGRLRRLLADLPVNYRGLATDPRFARLLRVAGMEDLLSSWQDPERVHVDIAKFSAMISSRGEDLDPTITTPPRGPGAAAPSCRPAPRAGQGRRGRRVVVQRVLHPATADARPAAADVGGAVGRGASGAGRRRRPVAGGVGDGLVGAR
ncbi:MAG: tetratricopeptide repeat protein, partial [Acidobacteriota bacterium]|nr:tetratricopeptide repeat protein [Acidobacteriota bacterium]